MAKQITVELNKKGGVKLAVSIPESMAGKKSYTELVYMAIDKLGSYYDNGKGKVSTFKTLHTTFSKLNDVIAKHYGFTDRNQVFAVYKHLLNINAISSRPVKMGLLIGLPGAIAQIVDNEEATSKVMASLGL